MILTLLFVTLSLAGYGVDISTYHSVSQLECMVNNGFTFLIPRCWCSDASYDSNCLSSTNNGYHTGMFRVDSFFFYCFSSGNGGGQVSTFWSQATGEGVWVTRIWFDIEGEWSSSYSTNQAFLMDMVEQARSIGIVYGIYCNYNYWTYFFGYDYVFPYNYEIPLWFAHYNDDPSFASFDAFGGWTWPKIKQYSGNVNFCDGWVDFNYEDA